MPNMYTADIEEKNITFEQYALRCSRAFDALISLHDEFLGAEIPDEIKPSDYHLKEVQRIERDISKLLAMTPNQRAAASLEEVRAKQLEIETYRNQQKELGARYDKMLEQIDTWIPPSKDHQALKDFMRSRIISSADIDCYESNRKPVKYQSGEDWFDKKYNALIGDEAYHRKAYAKEVENCFKATRWIQLLKRSLEGYP